MEAPNCFEDVENFQKQIEKEKYFDDKSFSEIDDESEWSENHAALNESSMKELGIEPSEIEINRFFNDLPIRILNSQQMPFFYAEDVAKVLGIRRINVSLKEFSGKEIVSQELRQKYNITTYKKYKSGIRRDNKMLLLTEFGVYRLIMGNKSQTADNFREFIYDVLYQLRTVGEYKVKAELEQLKTINETHLAEIGQLRQAMDAKDKRISEFKNLCEEIVLIEFKTNPYEILQTNIPACAKKKNSNGEYSLSKKHNTIDNPIPHAMGLAHDLGKILEITDTHLVAPCDRKAVSAANQKIARQFIIDHSPNSYLVTAKASPEHLTKGTVVHKVFVKDQLLALKKLSKLEEFKPMNASSKSNYFMCDKEKIITAMNAIAD